MIPAAGPPRARPPHPPGAAARLLTGGVLAATATILALVLGGVIPAVPGGGAGLLCCHGLYLVRLLRLARAAHRGRDARLLRPVGWLAAGLGLTAAGTLGGTLGAWLGPGTRVATVPLGAEFALVTLFLSVGAFLLGGYPAGLRSGIAGLRRALDGASVSLFLFFILWTLVFAPAGVRGAGLTAALLTSVAVAALLVLGADDAPGWPGGPRVAVGAALCLAGLAGYALALDYFAAAAWPVVAAVGAAVGSGLLGAGARRLDAAPAAAVAPGRGSYPLLRLPLIAAGVAAAYRLLQGHGLDPVSVELGVAGIAVVALREWVAATAAGRYAALLVTQDAHLRSLVSGSSDVTMVLDGGFLVRWQSSAAARQFGLSDQDVVGRPVVTLLHPEDVEQVAACLTELSEKPGDGQVGLLDARMRDGFGAWRDTEWSVSRNDLGAAAWSLVVHVRDVSRHKELERTVRRAAATDRLTGLANRQGLRSAAALHREYGTLILISLDIATVNNVKGHDVGDAALVEAARRLRATASHADLAARLEAATFAVLTEAGAVQAHLLATRLLTVLTEPYSVPGATAHLPASAGLTELGPELELDEALRRAELALHGTRGRRGARAVEWYDETTQAQLRRRMVIEQELPGAVARGELDLVYQPVVELVGGYPAGAEALLRWRHPALGAVAPADFIPVAEELGLLDEITHWVLHWSSRQLSLWARDGRDVWLSVNVGAGTLAKPAFVAAVTTSLQTHLVPAAQLVIEVAEPGITTAGGPVDPAADERLSAIVEHLSQLRSLGVRTAVDHFGTGSTSLSQLRVLPLDLIKIDRQIFGEPAARTGVVTAIVDVVVKLGRHIGVEVIAQGLESAADLEVARAAGCQYGQGYVVSRPAPPEHVEAYLDTHRLPRT
jgi:diguanylate cyclase (GGDEF)-like protein/PAS domain S-box-containing protein